MDQRTPASSVGKPQSGTELPAPNIAVILPTFNERANLPVMIERIARALADEDWEILIVDDNSPDGTSMIARELGMHDRRIRCLRRIGRRGLAGACIEGMLATQAPFVAVIDADLQHDEALLADMLARMRVGDIDLVVASRYCEGAQQSGLSENRARASRWSTALARRVLKLDLTDPMSGYFMIRRNIVDELAPALSTQGFKILLDIAATGGDRLRVAELPYTFGTRLHGDSKLDALVILNFGQLLLAKLSNDTVSYRFVLFCLVGLSGIVVHMSALATLHEIGTNNFGLGQTIATMIAIAWNFVFNNLFTYRDQRLTGWRFLTGLIRFQVICAIGAISNVGIATWIYDYDSVWWIAGLGGAVIGTVWNFVVSAAFVWRAN